MYVNRSDNNRLSFITMELKDSYLIKTDKGVAKRFQKCMKYFAEKFVEMQVNRGLDLLQYAEYFECDISNGILVSHPQGIALCNINSCYHNRDNFNITPFIAIESSSLLKGFEFTRGHMSDVDILIKEQEVMLICTDTLFEHELFLFWLAEQMETHWSDIKFNPSVKTYTTVYGEETYMVYSHENEKKFDFLKPLVRVQMEKNKRKRIDSLVENGLSVKEYLVKNLMYKYTCTDNQIYKACLLYGKPYSQMSKYLEKHGV